MNMEVVTNIVLVGVLFMGTAIGFAKGFLDDFVHRVLMEYSFMLSNLGFF